MSRRRLLLALAIIGLVAVSVTSLRRRRPAPATEVFQGVIYCCERFKSDAEGSGLVHWVRVDLNAPGIELYVTPLDSTAVSRGWQYRLKKTGTVIRDEQLAVAVNGTLFTSDSGWIRMTGDLARAVETTVADHRISHVWEHTYLLWFDDELRPRFEKSKPPARAVLSKARWGIGGQGVGLLEGKVREGIERSVVDSRTAIGIDPARKLLFLAVFEKATPRRALEKLAELGAVEGMLLDGGDSTSMALGEHGLGVRPGALTGDWLPVATHIGVRAMPLASKRRSSK